MTATQTVTVTVTDLTELAGTPDGPTVTATLSSVAMNCPSQLVEGEALDCTVTTPRAADEIRIGVSNVKDSVSSERLTAALPNGTTACKEGTNSQGAAAWDIYMGDQTGVNGYESDTFTNLFGSRYCTANFSGQRRYSISISTTDDSVVEGDETFAIVVASASSVAQRHTAVVVLIDNDTVPDQPSKPAAALSDGEITVTWTEALTASSYTVRYSTDSGSNWTTRPSVTGTTDTFSNPGAGSYIFQIRGSNSGGGDGNWSVSSDPLTVPEAPAAPAKPTATYSNGHVTVSWTATATQYLVRYSTDSGSTWTHRDASVPGTSDTFANPGGGTYVFGVRGSNESGDGAWSESSDELEVPDPPPPPEQVSAAHRNVVMTCPSGVTEGDTLDCTIAAPDTNIEFHIGITRYNEDEPSEALTASIPATASSCTSGVDSSGIARWDVFMGDQTAVPGYDSEHRLILRENPFCTVRLSGHRSYDVSIHTTDDDKAEGDETFAMRYPQKVCKQSGGVPSL